MDPNLFHLDWERTFEALGAIVVLAFVIERSLAWVFENRRLVRLLEQSGLKETIAFLVALAVCLWRDFDAISIILLREHTHWFGEVLTAGVIAGGSKASVRLFRDLLGFHSSAWAEAHQERRLRRATELRALGASDDAVRALLKG